MPGPGLGWCPLGRDKLTILTLLFFSFQRSTQTRRPPGSHSLAPQFTQIPLTQGSYKSCQRFSQALYFLQPILTRPPASSIPAPSIMQLTPSATTNPLTLTVDTHWVITRRAPVPSGAPVRWGGWGRLRGRRPRLCLWRPSCLCPGRLGRGRLTASGVALSAICFRGPFLPSSCLGLLAVSRPTVDLKSAVTQLL